jgi:hypothetical protein
MLAYCYALLDEESVRIVAVVAYKLLRQRDLLERRLVDSRRGRAGCCEEHRRLHDGGCLEVVKIWEKNASMMDELESGVGGMVGVGARWELSMGRLGKVQRDAL